MIMTAPWVRMEHSTGFAIDDIPCACGGTRVPARSRHSSLGIRTPGSGFAPPDVMNPRKSINYPFIGV
jgi:hypothetical protein